MMDQCLEVETEDPAFLTVLTFGLLHNDPLFQREDMEEGSCAA